MDFAENEATPMRYRVGVVTGDGARSERAMDAASFACIADAMCGALVQAIGADKAIDADTLRRQLHEASRAKQLGERFIFTVYGAHAYALGAATPATDTAAFPAPTPLMKKKARK